MKITKEPFFIVPSKVFSLGLSPYELSVVFYLCMRADNQTHTCWPSEKTMARECGMSPRTVRNALRSLEDKKLVRVEKHYELSCNGLNRQTSNHYYILLFENSAGDSSPEGIICTPPRQEMPPPEAGGAGEINKTISNITKSNIIKSIELRPAETEMERKKKNEFLDLKNDCIKSLELEYGVDESSCKMINEALINIWNRGCFYHNERTYSGDEVCVILCDNMTPSRLKKALDSMNERKSEVRSPIMYLIKCIFTELALVGESEQNKKKSSESSSFNIDDFFNAALEKTYGD